MSQLPPCVLFEDEHLLAVNKPAGLNTHSPSPYAGEGLYEWLRHREPRWASLAIVHRLDKETSGVLLFSKTPAASRSLTRQFTQRSLRKKYLLLTAAPVSRLHLAARSRLVRQGERYVSTRSSSGLEAETRFRLREKLQTGHVLLEAEPLTGRTHQVRAHAADLGFPILGDALYGGRPFQRVCLHAAELTVKHPQTQAAMTFAAKADFSADTRFALREALLNPAETNAWRLLHSAPDGHPGWHLDRLDGFLLSSSEEDALDEAQRATLHPCIQRYAIRGVYHKRLTRTPGHSPAAQASPQLCFGEPAPGEFPILENGVQVALRLQEGCSAGLFLDQRDNRRRLLTNHIAAGFSLFAVPQTARVLNTFAYTCAFSVCAAKAGAHTTSLDLSRKYLDWGRRNFQLNRLDPDAHDFIYGDTFDWLRRLAKKKRAFDLIILDPPTFSRSKEHGTFQVEKDLHQLVKAALPLLKRDGVLLTSTNCATLQPELFLDMISSAVRAAGRRIAQQHYAPQPPDFRISRDQPAYLKTVWLRLA